MTCPLDCPYLRPMANGEWACGICGMLAVTGMSAVRAADCPEEE